MSTCGHPTEDQRTTTNNVLPPTQNKTYPDAVQEQANEHDSDPGKPGNILHRQTRRESRHGDAESRAPDCSAETVFRHPHTTATLTPDDDSPVG